MDSSHQGQLAEPSNHSEQPQIQMQNQADSVEFSESKGQISDMQTSSVQGSGVEPTNTFDQFKQAHSSTDNDLVECTQEPIDDDKQSQSFYGSFQDPFKAGQCQGNQPPKQGQNQPKIRVKPFFRRSDVFQKSNGARVQTGRFTIADPQEVAVNCNVFQQQNQMMNPDYDPNDFQADSGPDHHYSQQQDIPNLFDRSLNAQAYLQQQLQQNHQQQQQFGYFMQPHAQMMYLGGAHSQQQMFLQQHMNQIIPSQIPDQSAIQGQDQLQALNGPLNVARNSKPDSAIPQAAQIATAAATAQPDPIQNSAQINTLQSRDQQTSVNNLDQNQIMDNNLKSTKYSQSQNNGNGTPVNGADGPKMQSNQIIIAPNTSQNQLWQNNQSSNSSARGQIGFGDSINQQPQLSQLPQSSTNPFQNGVQAPIGCQATTSNLNNSSGLGVSNQDFGPNQIQQMQQQMQSDVFQSQQFGLMNPNIYVGLHGGISGINSPSEHDPRQQHLLLSNLVAYQQHRQQQLYQTLQLLNNPNGTGAPQQSVNSQQNQFSLGQTFPRKIIESGGLMAEQAHLLFLHQLASQQATQMLSDFNTQQALYAQKMMNDPLVNSSNQRTSGSQNGKMTSRDGSEQQVANNIQMNESNAMSKITMMTQDKLCTNVDSDIANPTSETQTSFSCSNRPSLPTIQFSQLDSIDDFNRQQQKIMQNSSDSVSSNASAKYNAVTDHQGQVQTINHQSNNVQQIHLAPPSNCIPTKGNPQQPLRTSAEILASQSKPQQLKQSFRSINQSNSGKQQVGHQNAINIFGHQMMGPSPSQPPHQKILFRGNHQSLQVTATGAPIGGIHANFHKPGALKNSPSMQSEQEGHEESTKGKKKLKLKMIKTRDEVNAASGRMLVKAKLREEQIRKQAQDDIRKVLKDEFESLKSKLEEQENTIQDLQFEMQFSEGQNKKNKKEIKQLTYQMEICQAQIISLVRVFIQIIKYFLLKCVRQPQSSNQYGCATSLSNYSQLNPLGAVSNPGGFGCGKAALDGTMSSMTVTEHMLDRSFEDDRRNMFESVKQILISKMQVIQQTIKQIELSKEIQQVKDWHYDNFAEKKHIIQSPMASFMNRNKSLNTSNPRKSSIAAVRKSFNQAPSLKNLVTVRTQNSDKNPKNALSTTEYEEFGLKEDNEEGALQKLVGITAGKSTNENNNSLIMGSFENFDLGNNEVKETSNNVPAQDHDYTGNNSSVKGCFFNIDFDHDITPVETSKNKIFTEEITVEPSEFDKQTMTKKKNQVKRNKNNMSEFSRLSSNYQPYKTNNQNRLNNLNDSFNGSSQRKPSHSLHGIDRMIAAEGDNYQTKDKEARFKINIEPFNENKSTDQQNIQKRSNSNMARKDYQKNATLTHRGNVLVTDYSFDSFVDGFNARDRLEIDNSYKQKNKSIYQPCCFGKINNESISQGNMSHQCYRLKNQSDGGHGGSGDSFTLSNHNKDNNLFTSFHVQNRNEKLFDKYEIDGSISESKQRDRQKSANTNQSFARSAIHNNKPRISVHEAKNNNFLDNVESPILLKASRSVFNENTQQKYFDISNDDFSGLGRSQIKRTSAKQNFMDGETAPIDSKPFINFDNEFEQDSQQSLHGRSKGIHEKIDSQQHQVSNFMGTNLIRQENQYIKIDSAENLCQPDQEQLLRTTSHENSNQNSKLLASNNKPTIWNASNPKFNDSADFGSFQNTNEGNHSGEEIVSFDNLRKHIKKRNKAEETLGVVKMPSNSLIHGKSPGIMVSTGSLNQQRVNENLNNNVHQMYSGNLSQKSDESANSKRFDDINQEELPMFGNQYSNKSNVDSKDNNGSEHTPNSGDFGQHVDDDLNQPKNFISQKQNSTKNLTQNTLNQDTEAHDHHLNKSAANIAVMSNHHRQEAKHAEEKQHNFAYDSFNGSFGDMGGSIRSSPRNSIVDMAACSDHKNSEESVELQMKKSAKSANVRCDRRDVNASINSRFDKPLKQKTGKFSKQSNFDDIRAAKVVNSYFKEDNLILKDSNIEAIYGNSHEIEPDSQPVSPKMYQEQQYKCDVSRVSHGNQSEHQVPNFYQPENESNRNSSMSQNQENAQETHVGANIDNQERQANKD